MTKAQTLGLRSSVLILCPGRSAAIWKSLDVDEQRFLGYCGGTEVLISSTPLVSHADPGKEGGM